MTYDPDFPSPPPSPSEPRRHGEEVDDLRRARRLMLLMALLLVVVAVFYAYPIVRNWITAPGGGTPRPITPRGDLAPAEKSTIELYQNAAPSVVYITTATRRLNPFTRRVTEVPQGTGSGFVWDDRGHIVTNFHVVQNASAATVVLSDHTPYAAALVGVSPENDLAVLRITVPLTTKLRPIPIGTSHDLKVGQFVYAIGNPFGLDETLTTGVISAVGREITGVAGNPIEDVIQTDAAINPGNSGGPLLDSAGRLIGVNTAIYSPSGSSAGIGFAIPVDTANRVVPQLIAHGQYQRARMGLRVDDRVNAMAKASGIDVPGLVIAGVQNGSPAAAAGLRGVTEAEDGSIVIGDVLVEVNGRPIKTTGDLYAAMDKVKPGDPVETKVWRDGKIRAVKVGTQ